MSDYLTQFLAELRATGFEPKNGRAVADDKWHGCYVNGERKHVGGTYSLTILPDGTWIGCWFARNDKDKKYGWSSKKKDDMMPEEKKALKRAMDDQNRRRIAEEARQHARISKWLSPIVARMKPADDHPYLKRKGIKAHGLVVRAKGNELVMPCCDVHGTIWTIERITERGGKYLWRGGRMRGSSFCFQGYDNKTILVCEGFSTGASIFEATGITTYAAINAGNLKNVVKDLRQRFDYAKIVICADNDAFTFRPDGKTPWNPGIDAAKAAAHEIGGAYIAVPDFSKFDNNATKRLKDFNDLHAVGGLDEVKAQIKIPAAKQDEAPAKDETLVSKQHLGGGEISGDFGMNFKVLGYNEGMYYYFPYQERQIVALSASAHSIQNLFRLDSLEEWMSKFGAMDTSEKKMVLYATNGLMSLAKQRGVFKAQDRVRGAGTWTDEGRKVLHCGDALYVDGKETKLNDIESRFTYVASERLMRPASSALTEEEGAALRKICEAVTWENKLSGSLLAGWLVIAPLCGALPYRPHIYIQAEAESGKSTVLDKIVKPVLGEISINVDGGTTEPKIREMMAYDVRPVVYDEAEPGESMPAVIGLARKSSTGAVVGKFGQRVVKARFCFLFSAINPPVKDTADESRISFMVLKKNRKTTAIQDYNDLLALIEKTIDKDFSARLITRTLRNMDTLFKNIYTFEKAARNVVKGARASQIIGAMMAGLYSLENSDVIELAKAEDLVKQHKWGDHTAIEQDTDPTKLLQYILSSTMKINTGAVTKDLSIGDMILLAKEDDKAADKFLRNQGIAVKSGRIYFASGSKNLQRIIKDTDWGATKYTRMLKNIPGAEDHDSFYFGVGIKTSAVSVPLSIIDEEKPQQEFKEIPF